MATRLLLVSPSFFPAVKVGGPIALTRGLFDALEVAPEIEIRVLTTDAGIGDARATMHPDDWEDGARYRNSSLIRYCRLGFGRDISVQFIRELPALARWADVIQVHGVYCATTFFAMIVARVYKKPLIWSPHGSMQAYGASRRKWLKSFWNGALKLVAWRATIVMRASAASERSANERAFAGYRHVTIPNAVCPPNRLRRRASGSGRRVMFLGRLDPVKQVERMIRALPLLPDDVALDIHGDGHADYINHLRRAAADTGMESRVHFKGWLHGADKASAFANADVLVLPSVSENFGQVVIEALAHGVPVVASDGTPWQALETRECGRWVTATPECLAKACIDLLGRDQTILRRRARRWMREEYSNQNVATAFIEVYQDLAKTSPRTLETKDDEGRPGKICIVSSCGGHLTEVRALASSYAAQPHFYVLNDRIDPPPDLRGRTHFIRHSERDPWTLWNMLEMAIILWRERPHVILSTGAGPIVPAAIVGRFLFGCRIIYVESITRVTAPSLTGRIMYRLAHRFFYQWRGLRRHFPKGEFGGPLL